MLLDVSQLVLNNGAVKSIDEDIHLDDFSFSGIELHFKTCVHVKGTVTNVSGVLVMELDASVDFVTPCSRCVEPVYESLSFKINESFSKTDKGDSDEVIIIDCDEIDMKEVAEQNLCSQLPIHYLCSEDCKGLCPVCGCNLNHKTCDCVDDYIDPRLAVLKDFLK